jgi:FkbM family methyltransferase
MLPVTYRLHDRLRGRFVAYKRVEIGLKQGHQLAPIAASGIAKLKLRALSLLLAQRPTGSRLVPVDLRGGRMYVSDFAGLQVISEVLSGDAYPVSKMPSTARKIVDAGTHIGVTTRYFKSLYPDAEIHGFEPDPRTWRIALRNTEALRDVHIRNEALSSTNGTLTLARSTEGSWATSAYTGDGEKFTVRSVTLDSIITELGEVDILKLDVEGAEWDVLRASGLLDQVACIVGELHATAGVSAEDFLGMLTSRGFRISHDDIDRSEPKGTFVAVADPVRAIGENVSE